MKTRITEKFITVKASHTFIASNPIVIKEAVAFLKNESLFPMRK